MQQVAQPCSMAHVKDYSLLSHRSGRVERVTGRSRFLLLGQKCWNGNHIVKEFPFKAERSNTE